jgi:hypothetical protein
MRPASHHELTGCRTCRFALRMEEDGPLCCAHGESKSRPLTLHEYWDHVNSPEVSEFIEQRRATEDESARRAAVARRRYQPWAALRRVDPWDTCGEYAEPPPTDPRLRISRTRPKASEQYDFIQLWCPHCEACITEKTQVGDGRQHTYRADEVPESMFRAIIGAPIDCWMCQERWSLQWTTLADGRCCLILEPDQRLSSSRPRDPA